MKGQVTITAVDQAFTLAAEDSPIITITVTTEGTMAGAITEGTMADTTGAITVIISVSTNSAATARRALISEDDKGRQQAAFLLAVMMVVPVVLGKHPIGAAGTGHFKPAPR